MKFKRGRYRALVGVLLVIFGEVYGSDNYNGCTLKYKNHADDAPNFFIIANNHPGLCHIKHADNSSKVNYHSDRKYPEEIRPENVLGGLNYDIKNNIIIYWAKIANVDHSRIYRVHLNDSRWERVLEQDDDFRDMSYDWITKNLYAIMGPRNSIVAVNVEKPWYPSVIMYDRSQLTSLAVHPNKGYLFFVETTYWYGVRNKIFRANLDGASIREFNRSNSESRYYVAGLLVDFFTDRLYWCVPGLEKIQHSNLDGNDVRTINSVRVYSGQLDLSSRALAVDRHYVYYRATESNAIRRIEKSSHAKDSDFELVNDDDAPIVELVTYNQKSQKVKKDHPCRINRGGCDKYCFAVPANYADGLKRVCKCSFSEVLATDGVSCKRKALTR